MLSIPECRLRLEGWGLADVANNTHAGGCLGYRQSLTQGSQRRLYSFQVLRQALRWYAIGSGEKSQGRDFNPFDAYQRDWTKLKAIDKSNGSRKPWQSHWLRFRSANELDNDLPNARFQFNQC